MIQLVLQRYGHKWGVGWPYRPVPPEQRRYPHELYRLPDADHELLVEWWRRNWLDRIEGYKTRAAVLDALDLAARRESPPVAFQVRRLGEIIRDYRVTAIDREAA